MPISTHDLNNALIDYMIGNWTMTPMCLKGSGGFDLTGQHTGNLNDAGVRFIEFEFNNDGRRPAGVGKDSGIACLGFLDVQMFVAQGKGNLELAEIERQLFTLLERKPIATAQVRTALGSGKPFEFRGKLSKVVSFPIQYFET